MDSDEARGSKKSGEASNVSIVSTADIDYDELAYLAAKMMLNRELEQDESSTLSFSADELANLPSEFKLRNKKSVSMQHESTLNSMVNFDADGKLTSSIQRSLITSISHTVRPR